MTIHDAIRHALTAHDQRQSRRAGYNRYALGHYLGAVEEMFQMHSIGQDLAQCAASCFNDRPLAVVLKAIRDHK